MRAALCMPHVLISIMTTTDICMCPNRHADDEEEGSEDKKSKRARKDKERERRRSAPGAEDGDAGTPRRDGAVPMDVDAAAEAPGSGGKSDGEL